MLISFFAILFSFSTIEPLAVSNVPLDLLINANAVIRYENVDCHVKSTSSLEVKVEKAITILSAEGSNAGNVAIYYNGKGDKVKDLKIEIYNAAGIKVSKIKKKEVQDLSVYDGFSIANDSRVISYQHISNSFPYTIVYSYTKTTKNTLTIPSWYPLRQTSVSIENSSYSLSTDVDGMTFLTKPYNCENYPIDLNENENKFKAKNIRAQKSEKLTPSIYEYLPFVRVGPSKFNYFGFDGSYKDWNTYGTWMYNNMLTGRGDLPEGLINELEKMIPPGASNEDKARIIYSYVTNSTRYVSVQLGIGGFMPFKCSDVYNLKYGDCKALSNYTQNILSHFDIEAIYTEIKSDRDYNYSYDEELPGVDQGNHIVLCLPNEGDTLWLECTSSNVLFGYTHSGINNRKALLIKPTGSQLVTTGSYSPQENLSKRNFQLSITSDDHLTIEIDNKHHNLRHENMTPFLDLSTIKRDKYLKTYYYEQLQGLEINDFKVTIDSTNYTANEKGSFKCLSHIEKAGNYKMIPINITNYRSPEKLDKQRSFPLYIKDGKSDSIHISLTIPEGMVWVKSEKQNMTFENKYGTLNSQIIYNTKGNSIDCDIYILQNSGSFEPETIDDYNEYVKFIKNILDQKIILKPIE